jgi:hypothetical protein
MLPDAVPTLALTATCPPHILPTVSSALGTTHYNVIETTVNRPNTIYATHCLVGNVLVMENYRCLVSSFPFHPSSQPRTLIFCDNKKFATEVCMAINSFLPLYYRDSGVIEHYHLEMSEVHNSRVHKVFTVPNGVCRFLVATSAESTVSVESIQFRKPVVMGIRGLTFLMLTLLLILGYLLASAMWFSGEAGWCAVKGNMHMVSFSSSTSHGFLTLSLKNMITSS